MKLTDPIKLPYSHRRRKVAGFILLALLSPLWVPLGFLRGLFEALAKTMDVPIDLMCDCINPILDWFEGELPVKQQDDIGI